MAGSGVASQIDGIPIAAVTLASSVGVFGCGKMGIVDEQVGVPGEFEGGLPLGLFQILDVGEVGHDGVAVPQPREAGQAIA